jgi:hypothetical protein
MIKLQAARAGENRGLRVRSSKRGQPAFLRRPRGRRGVLPGWPLSPPRTRRRGVAVVDGRAMTRAMRASPSCSSQANAEAGGSRPTAEFGARGSVSRGDLRQTLAGAGDSTMKGLQRPYGSMSVVWAYLRAGRADRRARKEKPRPVGLGFQHRPCRRSGFKERVQDIKAT